MNATKARGQTNKPLPQPQNGVLVRLKATCDECHQACTVGGFNVKISDGYYTNGDKKLCKVCVRKYGII